MAFRGRTVASAAVVLAITARQINRQLIRFGKTVAAV
jgi:hypothetical protein